MWIVRDGQLFVSAAAGCAGAPPARTSVSATAETKVEKQILRAAPSE
jgi:hypothetical protein